MGQAILNVKTTNLLDAMKPRKRLVLLPLLMVAVSLPACNAQTYLGTVTGYSQNGKSIVVRADSSSVRFLFYASDVVRVDFLPSATTVLDSSLVVVRDTTENIAISVAEADSSIEITSSVLRIVCQKFPLRLSFRDAAGKVLLAEPSSGGLAMNQAARIANFALGQNDHFYGTGERGTALDRRGQAFDSYNTQIGGYTSPLPTMNTNIPFVALTNGYALYFENTYSGRFDFGVADALKFFYQAAGGELSYFFIASPTVQQQLERYTWLTGRQPLPPRWAFGFIQSKYGYRGETEAATAVQTMRQEKIPCDAIILDLYWYNNMGDLTWNTSAWPQPFTMMSNFLTQGIKTIVITEPYIVQPSVNFSEASSNGYLAKNSQNESYVLRNWWSCGCDAGLVDLTNPAAQQWWWGKHPSFFGNELSGIWTDLGEPESHPLDMQHYLGSASKVHNIFNLLWAKTIYEGFQQFRQGQRLFNLTRSGYAGIQRYGVIPWSGDVGKGFGGLAVQPPMMLGMGMSGLAYHNSDIGGFCCGTTTPELYVRWMQYGTFCPITRAHGTGQPTEPWGYGAQAESICTKFIRLRYQLLPYIYTMAHQNYETGLPLARPLFFDFPGDNNLWNESSSYLWGSAFLVSPVVVAGQTNKSLYLPQGIWIDFWTDRVFQGGRTVSVATPLDRMPVFVKAGSIVPMQAAMNYSDERPLDTLFLEMYPASDVQGVFTLYEDDGKTLDYQSGKFTQTTFSQWVSYLDDWSGPVYLLDIHIGPSLGTYDGKLASRVYLVAVHNVSQKPSALVINGEPVAEESSYTLLRQGGRDFYYDVATQRLFIQVPGVSDSSYHILAQNIQVTTSVTNSHDPFGFKFYQNYPNPFNPITTVSFVIRNSSFVTLKVYDVLGREVTALVDELKRPGEYTVKWNPVNMPSGVYFCRLQVGTFVQTKKIVIAK